ncbi:ABC-2 transporter permease [Ekhidna sp.]
MNRAMILRLIRRDFSAYRTQILLLSLFMLLMSMFITFINTNTLGIFSSGIGNIIMIIIGVFAVEQSSNVVRMHTASLPVTRKEIIIARFLSSSIIVSVNTIIHFGVFNALESIIHAEPNYTDLGFFSYALIYGILQLAIYFIVFYRVTLVVAVIIFVMPAILYTSISSKSGFLNDLIPGNSWYLFLFMLVTIGVTVLSLYSTIVYFRKKDL